MYKWFKYPGPQAYGGPADDRKLSQTALPTRQVALPKKMSRKEPGFCTNFAGPFFRKLLRPYELPIRDKTNDV